MAKFTNHNVAHVRVTDEFGRIIVFNPGETKDDQSEYLQRYVASGMLTRVGAAGDARFVPPPAVRNENMIHLPGATVPAGEWKHGDSALGTTPPARAQRVVYDTSTDVPGRVVKTEFVGARFIVDTAPVDTDPDGIYIDIKNVDMYVVVTDTSGEKHINKLTLTPVV